LTVGVPVINKIRPKPIFRPWYNFLVKIPVLRTLPLAVLLVISPVFVGAGTTIQLNGALRLGDRGQDVLILQKILNADPATRIAVLGIGSPGNENGFFGLLTKSAVIKFQEKYRSEVLAPSGLSAGTGYVGSRTVAKLNRLLLAANQMADDSPRVSRPAGTDRPTDYSDDPAGIAPERGKPTISAVSPVKVRQGDVVTVSGANFAPAGNRLTLGDGLIKESFGNLPSSDGRTIVFTYRSPEVKAMTEDEIRALPTAVLEQIERPIKAAAGTLSEALSAYKNIRSEAALRARLEENNRSFDDLYHYFWITVDNGKAKGTSKTALLYGLKRLPFESLAVQSDRLSLRSFGRRLGSLFTEVFPTADAVGLYGGGINSGIILTCTCGAGYLTFMTDFAGKGSGLYWFPPGYRPLTEGSPESFGVWLGGYLPMVGQCLLMLTYVCVDIPANIAVPPWGQSAF
jgi:hypothetical protein